MSTSTIRRTSSGGAYVAVLPSIDRRFWVIREEAGAPVAGCTAEPEDYYGYVESPCWRQPLVADVFDEEGGFLGPVPLPDGMVLHVRPYIRGDTVVALLEDTEGTPFVKRYRLRSPS